MFRERLADDRRPGEIIAPPKSARDITESKRTGKRSIRRSKIGGASSTPRMI